MHVRTGLSELIILISIDNFPTLYQNKYLHSLNIFKVVYIDENQMLIASE